MVFLLLKSNLVYSSQDGFEDKHIYKFVDNSWQFMHESLDNTFRANISDSPETEVPSITNTGLAFILGFTGLVVGSALFTSGCEATGCFAPAFIGGIVGGSLGIMAGLRINLNTSKQVIAFKYHY